MKNAVQSAYIADSVFKRAMSETQVERANYAQSKQGEQEMSKSREEKTDTGDSIEISGEDVE